MDEPVVTSGGNGCWTVTGELGFSSVQCLLDKPDATMFEARDAEVDLRGVTRADSAGLALLVEWLREAERRGGSIRFVNVPEQMKLIARVCGLDDILSL